MSRTVHGAAVVALALLMSASASAQESADDRLKARIGKKAAAAPSAKNPAKAPPAAQLSAGKDEEPDALPPVVGSDADVALLRGLLFAYEPGPREIRVIAVEDLALLNDPRALNPLAHLVLDPDPAVAIAATRAIGHFQTPRAEEILANITRHPALAPNVKLAAIAALPFQATPTAHELLTQLSRSTTTPAALKSAAQAALSGMTVPGASVGGGPSPADAPPLVPSSSAPGSQR